MPVPQTTSAGAFERYVGGKCLRACRGKAWREVKAWIIAPPRSVDLLAGIAGRKKATPAQIALAWLLARKAWIVPIPGTTKPDRLDENIGAVAVELSPDDLADIESAAAKIKVEGARYPEKLEKLTGR